MRCYSGRQGDLPGRAQCEDLVTLLLLPPLRAGNQTVSCHNLMPEPLAGRSQDGFPGMPRPHCNQLGGEGLGGSREHPGIPTNPGTAERQ